MLELLSSGFQVTWFRESGRHLWLAVVKPSSEIGDHFGLRQECFVIGNGYPKDFHQRTLLQAPPGELLERLDPAVRFVASDSAMADSFCAAWAQKNRASVVVFKGTVPSSLIPKEHLYSVLSSSLWRRDLFAEAEPVRLATEFFGRELVVNELLAKIVAGAPIGVFGLRKIGKSSLLGRVEDLLQQDQGSVSATAFLLGNASRLKSGRWWHVALDMLGAWQSKLQRLAGQLGSKIHAKADRLHDVVGKKAADTHVLASAFEKDVLALLKAARAIQTESGRDATRLVVFVDECDHLYPHLADAGHWRTDFFVLWNSLQTIKRSLEVPDELVYVLSGVNPSGVEQGSLQGQPNPLFETQRLYLGPMSEDDAGALLRGLGSRMGLVFDDDSVRDTYRLVGGHPLLLRRFGTAIHDANRNRASLKTIAASDVQRVFAKNKRDLFNQVAWILEHLATVSPDEERLLRDVATGGAQAYADLWGLNEFRETYAHHLERYGLLRFTDDLPEVTLSLIREALQKPAASELQEQKRELKELVETIEQAVRSRLRVDLEKDRTMVGAVEAVVNSIPSDTRNRPMGRQDLLDVGEVAGVAAVLEALNWGDYEILLNKYYDGIEWVGAPLEKAERLASIKGAFSDAHLVRHNNDHALKKMIAENGFAPLFARLSSVRDMFAA